MFVSFIKSLFKAILGLFSFSKKSKKDSDDVESRGVIFEIKRIEHFVFHQILTEHYNHSQDKYHLHVQVYYMRQNSIS